MIYLGWLRRIIKYVWWSNIVFSLVGLLLLGLLGAVFILMVLSYSAVYDYGGVFEYLFLNMEGAKLLVGLDLFLLYTPFAMVIVFIRFFRLDDKLVKRLSR